MPESKRFREAVTTGQVDVVRSLLARDPALVYSRDERGISVIRLACHRRQESVLELLMATKPALDVWEAAAANQTKTLETYFRTDNTSILQRSADASTTLMEAIRGAAAEAGEWLVGRGADYGAATDGVTPLRVACDVENEETAERIACAMLGNGADPNLAQQDARTPLHAASERGYEEVVRALLRKGANVDALDAEKRTPKDLANRAGRGRIATLLGDPKARLADPRQARFSSGANEKARLSEDNYGLPAALVRDFVVFAHFAEDRVKKMQTQCGDLLNVRAPWDETAIEAAAHMGNEQLAAYLAGKGAPVSICTGAMLGQARLVKSLLDESPERVRERGAHDFPLLIYPSFGKPYPEVVETLLAAGIDVNANARGRGALYFAVARGHEQIVQLLIDAGADVNLRAKRSMIGPPATPLQVAMAGKNPRIEQMLRKAGARV